MKTLCLAISLLTCTAAWAQTAGNGNQQAGLPAPTPYQVVERGANHQVWQRTVYERGPNGTVVARQHRYTELASGLNFWRDGQWHPSRADIALLPPGENFAAAATNGQHQAWFPLDIYQGAIQMTTPGGRQLVSRPVGLFYEDDNNSVLIAILTNSVGELVGSNEVVYPNAFEGAAASLRYHYTRAGFEQDVVVQGQLPDPAALGLIPARTRLGVLTAFFDTNNPVATPGPTDAADGLSDTTLSFGLMQMGPGRAFVIGDTNQSDFPGGGGTPTYKRWFQLNGHRFLMEEVPYRRVATKLEQLPPLTGRLDAVSTNLLAGNSFLDAIPARLLQPPVRGEPVNASPMRMADTGLFQPGGLVLDYVTMNASVTNFTFQGDTTYFLSGDVYCNGTNTIEGGAVIKYGLSPDGRIWANGPIVCQTGPYHPAILTSMDDDTVGETISGSTGTPSGYNCQYILLYPTGTSYLHNLQFRYAYTCVLMYYGSANFSDCQFVNSQCALGFEYGGGRTPVDNVLFYNVLYPFSNNNGWIFASQVTAHNVAILFQPNTYGKLFITNSLLVCVTNWGSGFVSVDNATNSSDAGVFQMVGAGSHYLPADSPYHGVGTTNIDPAILADIATKTTYAPIVYSNTTLSAATTFSPQAQRDNGGSGVDLGYHYDPIDYFFGGVTACSNVTFSAGTAVGWFEPPGSGGSGYGIALSNDLYATFNGTVTAPCIFARYDTVQEGCDGLWTNKGTLGGLVNGGTVDQNNPAAITVAFTGFSHLAGDPGHFCDGTNGQPLLVQARNCEFYGGASGYNMLAGYTNCLFYRAGFGISTASTYPYQYYVNCTFYGGDLTFGHSESGAPYWYSYIHNCAFDQTTFSIDDPFGTNTAYADYDYNAFDSGAAQPPTEGANTVTVTGGFNWQNSWFGGFYQATDSPLIDAGDRTADQLGLYHFTTQTNMEWNSSLGEYTQIPETNSVVDIGYHYVAIDQYGNPIDSNGDGIPDYLEDANGNGQLLTVTLTTPANNSYYQEPATIPLQVSIEDWRSIVTNVTFYYSSTSIASITNAPFSDTWPIVAAGQYALTATASDLAGAIANSASITVTVTNLCGY